MRKLEELQSFDAIKISLASPEQILSWSYGEVTEPETINYRTYKAEKDGLFDERIFGPIKDFECYCGKYKRIRYKGVICDKCGVEVTHSRVRRERMGHITLVVPCAHPWFYRTVPSPMRILLDIPSRSLEAVLYFSAFLISNVDEDKKEAVIKNLTDELQKLKKDVEESFGKRIADEEKSLASKLKKLEKDKGSAQVGKKELERESRRVVAGLRDKMLAEQDLLEHSYIVIEKRLEEITECCVVHELDYLDIQEYVEKFAKSSMGAEAVLQVLNSIDLEKLVVELRAEIGNTRSKQKGEYLRKRVRLVEDFISGKVNPSWTIVKYLPVIPPDLRPMVQLEGGRFATSDHNDLYRRVINRNNRLSHLLDLGAPEIIVRNEKRMLQEAVDALLLGTRASSKSPSFGKELRSLSDLLKGKKGRFRRNLLGKRVDYSGRAVITPGPSLKMDQCGLPKEIALELCKPFVLREIILEGLAPNLKSARRVFEARIPEVWSILERVIKDRPVLLNRAPSLHRLSIQAFYPQLIEGNAIQLHTCVLGGFNADFDGDQMAVHLPLSEKAVEEAKELLISSNNLRKPSNGSILTGPIRDMLVGLYYLTEVVDDETETRFFANSQEALLAHSSGKLNLRSLVNIRMSGKLIKTTVGRVLFNQILPESFEYFNDVITKSNRASNILIERCLQEYGRTRTVGIIDDLKALGFKFSTVSGISMGITDSVVPPKKAEVVEEASKKVAEIDANYQRGLITKAEKARLSESVWTAATNEVDDLAWEGLDDSNPIKVMVSSGARGSRAQVKQISGMGGLVVDPTGKVVEMPILSNYAWGLSGFEYFSGARGARKGVVDTALRTADAGYLTRRLVDVAQSVLTREDDCGTNKFLIVAKADKSVLVSFEEKIVGRTLAKAVEGIAGKGEIITTNIAKKLAKSSAVKEIKVRSPLHCETEFGVCAKCYGADLSTNEKVAIGVPVGVIGAQSIGEPGTQLTLRTYHAGGIVGQDITQGLPRVEELVEARTPKFQGVISELTGKVSVVNKEGSTWVIVKSSDPKAKTGEVSYQIDAALEVQVKSGDSILAGTPITNGHLDPKRLLKLAGREAAARYIVDQIQEVYSSQGVYLHDKHIEVVIRQMFSKVRVVSSGDTSLLSGELIRSTVLKAKNAEVKASGGKPAKAESVLLGITQASLHTESFLSAASFVQTVRVLTEASIAGKVDYLKGLKENVIVGRLIPVGKSVMETGTKN